MSVELNFGQPDQLAKLEVYEVRLQKLWSDLTQYDAVSRDYVDIKLGQAISDLVGFGTPEALNTLKEISDVIKSEEGKTVEQILSMIGTAAGKISTLETSSSDHSSRISSLEGVGAEGRLHLLEQTVLTGTDEGEADLVTRMLDVEGVLAGDLKLTEEGEVYPTVSAALLAEHQAMTDTNSVTFNALANKIQTKLGYDSPAENFVLAAAGFTGAYQDANAFVNGAISQEAKAREDGYDVLDEKIDTKATLAGANTYSGDNTFQNNVILNIDQPQKYLYFSNVWRLSGDANGSRLIFEHYKNGVGWKTALPFIVG